VSLLAALNGTMDCSAGAGPALQAAEQQQPGALQEGEGKGEGEGEPAGGAALEQAAPTIAAAVEKLLQLQGVLGLAQGQGQGYSLLVQRSKKRWAGRLLVQRRRLCATPAAWRTAPLHCRHCPFHCLLRMRAAPRANVAPLAPALACTAMPPQGCGACAAGRAHSGRQAGQPSAGPPLDPHAQQV
jgi:hypothetical protein